MPVGLRDRLYGQWTPIKGDLFSAIDVIAEFRGTAVDIEPTFPDPGLDFASRAVARRSKKFLNSFRQPGRAIG